MCIRDSVCAVKVKAFANADGNSAARVTLQALTDAYATGFTRTTSFPDQGYGRLNICFRDALSEKSDETIMRDVYKRQVLTLTVPSSETTSVEGRMKAGRTP